MELTKEILELEKEEMKKLLSSTYGKDSKVYRDMMFAIDTYHFSLKFILSK
jgi:hypothetical protein